MYFFLHDINTHHSLVGLTSTGSTVHGENGFYNKSHKQQEEKDPDHIEQIPLRREKKNTQMYKTLKLID